jgi:hypothetical protein
MVHAGVGILDGVMERFGYVVALDGIVISWSVHYMDQKTLAYPVLTYPVCVTIFNVELSMS